jgi:hypothetical protein
MAAVSDPPAKPPDIAELGAQGLLTDNPLDGGRVVDMFPRRMRQPGEDDDEPSALTERELLEAAAATALAQGRYTEAQAHLAKLRVMASSGTFERPMTAPEIYAPLPEIQWTLQRLELAPGAPSMFAGYGFSGKTLAAMALAQAMVAGREAWGRLPAEEGPVLHLDYEQGDWLTRRRYQRLARGMEIPHPEELPIELMVFPGLQLLDESEDSWCRLCEGKRLVIVDSFRAAARHVEENSSVARQPLDLLGRVSQRTGATVLVLHHARKASRDAAGGAQQAVRGSGALYDALQSCVVFTAGKGEPPVLHHEKARVTGQLAEDIALQIRDVAWQNDPRWGLTVEIADLEDIALQAVRDKEVETEAAVLAFVDRKPGCSKNRVRGGVNGRNDKIDGAIEDMIQNGRLRNSGTASKMELYANHVPEGSE